MVGKQVASDSPKNVCIGGRRKSNINERYRSSAFFNALAFVTSLFFSVDGFVMEGGESRYPLPSRIVVGSKMFSLSKQRGTMTKYHLEIFS